MKRLISRTRLLLPSLIMAGILGFACFSAPAQAQIFDGNLSSLSTQPAPPPSLAFSMKNAQLKDILDLQHQIQTLRQLIDYEKAVNEIVRSSINLGMTNPNIPAPYENLCRSVPANIPCAQAYDNLYDKDLTLKNKAPLIPITLSPNTGKASAGVDSSFSDITGLSGFPDDLPDNFFERNILYWTDITCMNNDCSAVITTDPQNSRARFRVTVGEKLAGDAIIRSISASGIQVTHNDTTITIGPAPRL